MIEKSGRNLKVNFGSIKLKRFKKFWEVYVNYSYN
jgi:hypothetical protein